MVDYWAGSEKIQDEREAFCVAIMKEVLEKKEGKKKKQGGREVEKK